MHIYIYRQQQARDGDALGLVLDIQAKMSGSSIIVEAAAAAKDDNEGKAAEPSTVAMAMITIEGEGA
jgi:hypothetical protein